MGSGQLQGPSWAGVVSDVVKFVFIAFLIVTPLRLYIAQPFIVSGASMAPTFEQNEYVVIDKLSYRFQAPERGDIIIFRYPLDASQYFIKRIIGLPGEEVSIQDGVVTVTGKDGVAHILDEPYRSSSMRGRSSRTLLAEGEYFVLGDNRLASADSREWGPLQERFIVGRAFVALFPLRDAALYPGDHSFPQSK